MSVKVFRKKEQLPSHWSEMEVYLKEGGCNQSILPVGL